MTKRLLAALVCLLLIMASGCEFFAVPSASPSQSDSPEATVQLSSADTSPGEATGSTEPAETPTEEATTAPAPTINSAEGMIFPDSDTRLLKWDELIVLDADKLAYARNEIYARAGYKFTTKKYADYYGALSWYNGVSDSTPKFSDIQWANIHLIQAAEDVIAGKLHEVTSGTVLDLDQDGTLDTLTFNSPDQNHMNIQIKEGSTTTSWNILCDNPSKKVYLGDIDRTDHMIDIFVDEFGPSDDNAMYVAGIKHHAFLNRTSTDQLPGAITDLKFDGKGAVTTKKRMNILMTWYCSVKYKIDSSGKLAFVPQSSYSMGNFKCKTLVQIPLKASASSSSAVALTVPADTDVVLVSTDDEKWIKIKAPSGAGWLEMATLTTLADPNIPNYEAFDGLILAD